MDYGSESDGEIRCGKKKDKELSETDDTEEALPKVNITGHGKAALILIILCHD